VLQVARVGHPTQGSLEGIEVPTATAFVRLHEVASLDVAIGKVEVETDPVFPLCLGLLIGTAAERNGEAEVQQAVAVLRESCLCPVLLPVFPVPDAGCLPLKERMIVQAHIEPHFETELCRAFAAGCKEHCLEITLIPKKVNKIFIIKNPRQAAVGKVQ
jgi:hypothetical protein